MAYKGKFSPKYPKKYNGDVRNIVFRSLWEKTVMEHLDNNTLCVEWSSEEVSIRYYDPTSSRWRRYFPDFIAKFKTNEGKIIVKMIEVKPYAQTIEPKPQKRKTKKYITEVTTYATNYHKWKAAREYCADRGWEFMILTEKEIYKRHK